MSHWQVVFDVSTFGAIKRWDKYDQIKLDFIHSLLREDGPDGLDWNPMERAGQQSWDHLVQPYRATFWTATGQRFYRITLEVRPGQTIIVRDAACGVYRRGPKGR